MTAARHRLAVRGGAVVYADADGWRAFIGSTNGNVYAVDSGGRQLWQARTGAQIQTYGALGGTTFYTPSDDFRVYAFDVGPPMPPDDVGPPLPPGEVGVPVGPVR